MIWQSSLGNFFFWHPIKAIVFLPLFEHWNKFIVFQFLLCKSISIQQIFCVFQPPNIKHTTWFTDNLKYPSNE